MDREDARIASQLAALGHEARLRVFRLLVRAGEDGLPMGEIARMLGLPASTLQHHLGALAAAGLVRRERRGRATISRADYATMRALFAHVEQDCCAGVAAPEQVA